MSKQHPYGAGDSKWFVHDRFGMFIHWGTYAAAARHEWVKSREKISEAAYRRYFDHFNPDMYDPAEWARAAKQAGMKYFVITTKHHEGFCLWDTKYTDYKATNTPYGKDLLKPMVKAFREAGIRVGFYYSLIDWHHPEFTVDCIHPRREEPEARAKNRQRDIKKYAAYMRHQVTELLTKFGDVDVLWFDYSYPVKDGKGRDDWESEKLIRLVRKLRPDILVDDRLDLPGSGDIITPEQYQPRGWVVDAEGKPALWEACQTFSGAWGYHRDEQTWKSVKLLLTMLVDSVSKGGNLLLNVGPTARGYIDQRALDRLDGIGQWMKYHSRAIYGCTASPFTPPADCRYTQNGKRLYLHILNWPLKNLFLEGLADKVEYAQFLHDASEVKLSTERPPKPTRMSDKQFDQHWPRGYAVLDLPPVQPSAEIPVVELFLK